MRYILIALIVCINLIHAQTNSKHVQVRGYNRSDGTYVQPHMRTAPNNTNSDNFSTIGNTNPYTGQPGHIPSDRGTPSTYNNTSQYLPNIGNNNLSSNTSRDNSNYNLSPNLSYSTTNYKDYLSECYEENTNLKDKIDSLESALFEAKEKGNFVIGTHYKIVDSIQQNIKFQISETKQQTIDSVFKSNILRELRNSSNDKLESSSIFFLIIIVLLIGIIMFKK